MVDLQPAAQRVTRLLDGVRDDDLAAPTPCEAYTVGDLLDHLVGLTIAFRHAATKTPIPRGDAGVRTDDDGSPRPSADHLAPDWRSRLPVQLDELVAAWRDPAAYEGMTEAGGVALPGGMAAMVALDELVLHGWDLARATGQRYDCDRPSAEVVFRFASMSAAPGQEESREGLFGPVVDVPGDAPLFDRALGLAGRDPAWQPSPRLP
jgi:uncharacterized protein (TIGR03086 family)